SGSMPRVAMLDPAREVVRIAEREQSNLGFTSGMGHVVGEFAVDDQKVLHDRSLKSLRELVGGRGVGGELDAELQAGVQRSILDHLEHELAGDVFGELGLLDSDRYVFGVDVGAVVRDREVRTTEDVDERQ